MIDDILTQDQRLVIVRSLNEYHGELNESVLQDCLEAYGHKVSRDRVRVLLAWLAEQDIADGRATVPGVKKPRRR